MILPAAVCFEIMKNKVLQRYNIYVILIFLGPREEGQLACSSPCGNQRYKYILKDYIYIII